MERMGMYDLSMKYGDTKCVTSDIITTILLWEGLHNPLNSSLISFF